MRDAEAAAWAAQRRLGVLRLRDFLGHVAEKAQSAGIGNVPFVQNADMGSTMTAQHEVDGVSFERVFPPVA